MGETEIPGRQSFEESEEARSAKRQIYNASGCAFAG